MKLEEIVDAAGEFTAQFDPACWSGDDAARLAEVAASGERFMATIKILAARRAAATGCWARASGAVSAEQWLATISGMSEGAAREELMTASRLDVLDATAEAMRAGRLSVGQAAHVTAAAAVDPNAEQHLLEVAERSGVRELREGKERVIAAASDEVRAHQQAVRERHLRTWTRGLATHGSFSGPTEQVATILAALEPLERKQFEAARAAGEHESQGAYRFDALVDLATAGAPTTVATRSEPVVRVRVGLRRLLGGGSALGEEMCEIPGVGLVPTAHAREVLSHGLLELVISDGVDVQNVVSKTRYIPEPLKIALEERDGKRCKIRECARTIATERHHVEPFADHGITSYRVLGDVCPDHHDLITHRGYTVVEHDDGSWSLRAPPHTNAA
jgi:hypothetical protein